MHRLIERKWKLLHLLKKDADSILKGPTVKPEKILSLTVRMERASLLIEKIDRQLIRSKMPFPQDMIDFTESILLLQEKIQDIFYSELEYLKNELNQISVKNQLRKHIQDWKNK